MHIARDKRPVKIIRGNNNNNINNINNINKIGEGVAERRGRVKAKATEKVNLQ